MKILKALSIEEIDRIVEMAWEDRTPFDAIEVQFGINESQVIQLMRKNMKESSFKMWRARVQGRKTKHRHKSPEEMDTFKSRMQRGIALNKISKR
ncbi:MAG: TIGR03643 family protein [Algoriphagus sp.]|uniref:TIGR03643 family protein n=1 Tax=Algoriphagus sp. TaxID=1872435 RepID=UPI0026147D8E|nr:TIGR03643 family protein [Algoriphagus sp.]MDG1276732.1 TIGR03643 family protein [Algoriphagus sp.]